MDGIPTPQQLDQDLADIARKVAFELGRPWRVEELRAEALEAYPTANRRTVTSGLPPKQTDELIRSLIYEQVKQAGERIEALPPDEEKPTPKQIETALGTFTLKAWITLINTFGQVEAEALHSHIRRDTGELKQRFGTRKVERIKARSIMRYMALWLEKNRSKAVAITDPYGRRLARGGTPGEPRR
jgi:hypothetical protein